VKAPFEAKVSAKSATTRENEKSVLNALEKDERNAALNHKKTETTDLRITTYLKIGLSIFISLLICA